MGLTGWTWRKKEIVKGKKFNIMMMTTTLSHTPDMEDYHKTRGFVEQIYTHTYVHTHTPHAHIVADTHTHARTCSKIPGIDTQTLIERECEREHIDKRERERKRREDTGIYKYEYTHATYTHKHWYTYLY